MWVCVDREVCEHGMRTGGNPNMHLGGGVYTDRCVDKGEWTMERGIHSRGPL